VPKNKFVYLQNLGFLLLLKKKLHVVLYNEIFNVTT
jgi:hypothetical protein